MKFKKILQEKTISITSNTPLAKRLRDYRGVNFIVLEESEPPDVHGIPKELEAYGRGGFEKDGNIWLDGGPQGSRTGHPNYISDGFYWGADYDVSWKGSDGVERKGVIYIRGRAGTGQKRLEQSIQHILSLIFKRLPRQ